MLKSLTFTSSSSASMPIQTKQQTREPSCYVSRVLTAYMNFGYRS